MNMYLFIVRVGNMNKTLHEQTLNALYNLGIKHVFESFEEEIEDWTGVEKENAQYLIDKVKKLYKDELNEINN